MKVSVIIPAYNIENYISKCVQSIIEQTLKELEIIIVNDGSTDNTLKLIKDLSLIDKRIKIIDKSNQGSIEARKTGLEIAKGEYVLFVDGDDWLDVNTLEKLYKSAINNNSDIVIYNAYTCCNNTKRKLNIYSKDIEKDCIKNLLLGKIYPTLWAKFISLKYIKNNKIEFVSDISYAEDLATSASLFMYNPKISYVNEYLYNYNLRESSITNIVNTKVLEIDKALKFIKSKLMELNIYEHYKKEYEYMVYIHILENTLLSRYYKYKDIGKILYKQYRNYRINIRDNKYIQEIISSYYISKRIRIKLYCISYSLGRIYDFIIKVKNKTFK